MKFWKNLIPKLFVFVKHLLKNSSSVPNIFFPVTLAAVLRESCTNAFLFSFLSIVFLFIVGRSRSRQREKERERVVGLRMLRDDLKELIGKIGEED